MWLRGRRRHRLNHTHEPHTSHIALFERISILAQFIANLFTCILLACTDTHTCIKSINKFVNVISVSKRKSSIRWWLWITSGYRDACVCVCTMWMSERMNKRTTSGYGSMLCGCGGLINDRVVDDASYMIVCVGVCVWLWVLVVYAKIYTQTYWSHYAMASTRNPSGMCGMADNWAAATESYPVHRLMRRHFVFSAHYRCRQQSWFDGVRIITRRISPIATVFGGLKWNFRSRNLLTLMMFLFPPQRYEAWRKATDSCGRFLDL